MIFENKYCILEIILWKSIFLLQKSFSRNMFHNTFLKTIFLLCGKPFPELR